ncbi:uncharacterized protein LOC133174785 [Saccostrea echinata]|uniref:uncharacterized protein LOC133174785 n=1 Tax=Saccostrea echinata TaxID=191078 RepID=UPI002A7EBBF7|nr:uncharacterized protein LOC133174785 [Saccostrea echinata]
MDPQNRGQGILLCELCQTAALQSHCELCQISLCKACVGSHLSDSSQRHKVIPYKHQTSYPPYPKCLNHTQKHCDLHREECDIPVCSTCIFSSVHKGHNITDAQKKLRLKTKDLEKDLRELEKEIYPAYEEIVSDIKSEKETLEEHYEKLTSAITKQREDWHGEINIIVNKQKSEIDAMKTKHLAAINKQETEIKRKLSELRQSILELKKILDSNDVSLTSSYKSRTSEFRSISPKVNVSLLTFSSRPINIERLNQMFGSLSALSTTSDEDGYTLDTSEALSYPPSGKPLLDKPELLTTIKTRFRDLLYSVTCLNDEEIWICGEENIISLYNLQSKLLKSIQTKSGKKPNDIAVTRSGHLVYTDSGTRTVNIVENEQVQEVIRLQEWLPYNLCSTSSGDLLVSMNNDDYIQSEIVRYSGSTEKQTIQFDNKGHPLYSFSGCKYISENRNLDICTADYGLCTVVVVNLDGQLRFRYIGHASLFTGPFDLVGIATDSQSQILISDCNNKCIHILHQDGQFLCYIDNIPLASPFGLFVDAGDNLFVVELGTTEVKKIKYM